MLGDDALQASRAAFREQRKAMPAPHLGVR
jgi:hypothetical protein